MLADLQCVSEAIGGRSADDTGSGKSEVVMAFSDQELADIHLFAMRGMTLAEHAMTDDMGALGMLTRGPVDLASIQQQIDSFRGTVAKLTLAVMAGSGMAEVQHRAKD